MDFKAFTSVFKGATPEQLKVKFVDEYVPKAVETLTKLTAPEGGVVGAGGSSSPSAPTGYADLTTPMNVVELFNAQGLVFVSSWKAGLAVSAMHGHGFVFKRLRGEGVGHGGPAMARWSAPLPIELNSAALGLTVGYAHVDSIIVLDTEKAVQSFYHTQVSMGNDFTVRMGKQPKVPLGGDGGGHIDLAKVSMGLLHAGA